MSKKVVIMSYYSSINIGNISMLKGLVYSYPRIKKYYLPVFYSEIEKIFLKKEKLDKKVESFYFLNIFKLFYLLAISDKILFLVGDNLTGMYGIQSRIFTLLSLLPILIFGKKTIILSSTIFPTKFNRKVLEFFLRKVKKIYVRERNAVEELRKINNNVFLAKDLSLFFLDREKKRLKKVKKEKILTVVVRCSTPRFMGIKSDDFVFKISKQLEKFLKNNLDYRIVLLPFQIGVKKKNDDRNILEQIYNNIVKSYRDRVKFINKLPSLIDVLKIIRKSRILVSSRLHACLFASKLGTSFIAIIESPKIEIFVREYNGFFVTKDKLKILSKLIEKMK